MNERALIAQMAATLAAGEKRISEPAASDYVASAVALLAAVDRSIAGDVRDANGARNSEGQGIAWDDPIQ